MNSTETNRRLLSIRACVTMLSKMEGRIEASDDVPTFYFIIFFPKNLSLLGNADGS